MGGHNAGRIKIPKRCRIGISEFTYIVNRVIHTRKSLGERLMSRKKRIRGGL
jgi:hypothetical protein